MSRILSRFGRFARFLKIVSDCSSFQSWMINSSKKLGFDRISAKKSPPTFRLFLKPRYFRVNPSRPRRLGLVNKIPLACAFVFNIVDRRAHARRRCRPTFSRRKNHKSRRRRCDCIAEIVIAIVKNSAVRVLREIRKNGIPKVYSKAVSPVLTLCSKLPCGANAPVANHMHRAAIDSGWSERRNRRARIWITILRIFFENSGTCQSPHQPAIKEGVWLLVISASCSTFSPRPSNGRRYRVYRNEIACETISPLTSASKTLRGICFSNSGERAHFTISLRIKNCCQSNIICSWETRIF